MHFRYESRMFTRALLALCAVLLALVIGATWFSYKRNLVINVQSEDSFAANHIWEAVQQVYTVYEAALSPTLSGDDQDLQLKSSRALESLMAIEKRFAETSNEEGIAQVRGLIEILQNAERTGINSQSEREALATGLAQGNSALILEATKIIAQDREHDAVLRDAIENSARNSVIFNLAAVAICLLGMGYFIYLSLQNQRMSEQQRDILSQSESSSRAKSRLLTMLSHELRTPMNGVLGLVSLGLQNRNSPAQTKLLKQVQSSAMELVSFLEDMLNFATIDQVNEDEKVDELVTPLFIVKLSDKIKSVSKRYDVDFVYHPTDNLPPVVGANFERLYQSLFYAFSHIAKNTLSSHIDVYSKFENGHWFWRFDVVMDRTSGENWNIHSLVGETVASDNFIETDTIESTMFRGLLESMNGEIRIFESEQNPSNYRVVIGFPVTEVQWDLPVRVVDYSENGRLLTWLKSVLKSENFEIIGKDELAKAKLVFLDTENSNFIETVRAIRRIVPEVFMVGVGEYSNLEIFDVSIESIPEVLHSGEHDSPDRFQFKK